MLKKLICSVLVGLLTACGDVTTTPDVMQPSVVSNAHGDALVWISLTNHGVALASFSTFVDLPPVDFPTTRSEFFVEFPLNVLSPLPTGATVCSHVAQTANGSVVPPYDIPDGATVEEWQATYIVPIGPPRGASGDEPGLIQVDGTPYLAADPGDGVIAQIAFTTTNPCPESTDTDGDGVPDDHDAFPNSNMDPTVTVDGRVTTVANQVLRNGATFNDLIGVCADESRNAGAFTACVTRHTVRWLQDGLITSEEQSEIIVGSSGTQLSDTVVYRLQCTAEKDHIADLVVNFADGTGAGGRIGCGETGEIQIPDGAVVTGSGGRLSRTLLIGDWYSEMVEDPNRSITIRNTNEGLTLTIEG